MNSQQYLDIPGTVYCYDRRLKAELDTLRQRVNVFRTLVGTLSGQALQRLEEFFRLKNIYNSNAVEGNTLSLGETQLVIQKGLTITGKPLKDTVEAKNLSHALDFFRELARQGKPITVQDIRNIQACILQGIDDQNAGRYRLVFVEISGSKHKPPDPALVPAQMDELGYWLAQVSDPAGTFFDHHFIDPVALACAAHAWFVNIHPFTDGNGRTARLLMNLLLMRNGYPVTIITKDDRHRYYDALEESDEAGDLTAFMRLVMESVEESLEVYEQAARQQIDMQQFVRSLLAERQDNQLRNDFDVFESAMRLLRGYFDQVVRLLNDEASKQGSARKVGLKDYGGLEFEKYHSLRQFQSAKKTWFFRLSFYDTPPLPDPSRYLFFFGFSSSAMSAAIGPNQVTLHTAAEVYPSYFERLGNLSGTDLPDIIEIGYAPGEERFVILNRAGEIRRVRAEEIAQDFIRQAFSAAR